MVNDTHIFRNQTILKAIDCKFYFGRLILTLFFFLIKKKTIFLGYTLFSCSKKSYIPSSVCWTISYTLMIEIWTK